MTRRRGPLFDYPRSLHLPPVGTEEEDWRVLSLCRNHPDPDPLWNPMRPEDAELGKSICNQCPVKQRCGEYAKTRREPYGTWGGVTEWERDFLLTGKIRKRK